MKMKALFQILIFSMMSLQIHAQPNEQHTLEKKNIRWKKFESAEQQPAQQLAKNKDALQLGNKDGLTLITTKDDQTGFRHYRYQQNYDGIPIEGAIYLMHEKNNLVKHANGQLIHELNLSTIPSMSVDVALPFALQHLDADLYAWNDPSHEKSLKDIKQRDDATFYPSGELVIINPKHQQEIQDYRLAYKFDIYAIQPLTRELVYVDAHTGEILATLEKIHNCTDVSASGTTNHSGSVNFTACQTDANKYVLKSNVGGGMQVFNALNQLNNPGVPFGDTDNIFEGDPTATEVHWATEKTYWYFYNTFGRNSLDDNNMPLLSWIHYGESMKNAYWNGLWMTYGDGDVNYRSFTSPDIVAHEITHGIIEFSANLNYNNESGALNESFSDIFAEVIESTLPGGNDWIIGSDIVINTEKNGLRNMSNPNDPTMLTYQPDTYKGNHWYSGTGDYGGVHINSGVPNYWFYLLAMGGSGTNDNGRDYNISGIGINKAADIAYLTLTQYLTSSSTFSDAREGSITAAESLLTQGLTSSDIQQVEMAWCAVGVGDGCGSLPNPCIANDSLALVALYNATDGANWTNSWNLNEPMDNWHGVTLNMNGCVISLNLYNNNLTGSIPAQIGDLVNLELLKLDGNQLSGTIPAEIGNLTNLINLELDANLLTGTIPAEISNLINLTNLELDDNANLSGCYDASLWTLCDQLLNEDNKISSGTGLPDWGNFCNTGSGSCTTINVTPCRMSDSLALVELYNATNGAEWTNKWNLNESMDSWYGVGLNDRGCVVEVELEGNNLDGNIPAAIGGMAYLRNLFLHDNQLTGNIPNEIYNLTNLRRLYLRNNQLDGEISAEIYNLINLTSLDLGTNQLTGNIPDTIGDLIKLRDLRLDNNDLSGIIPFEIGNLINLNRLLLHDNGLSGSIPIEIGNLTNLTELWLKDNDLSGTIPVEIGNLINLNRLYLQENMLIGSIPATLGNLTNLTSLYINNNELSGNIPSTIGNLINLNKLYLYDNQLTGNIPTTLGNLTNLTSLYINNNELSGSIPSAIGNLINLNKLYLYGNQLSGCYNLSLHNLCNTDNADISNGNNFDATWEGFCSTQAGSCPGYKVWPGDFNSDGIVNGSDLLYWGVSEGYTGVPRPGATTNWEEQDCPDWSTYVAGINTKHSDGNGDGIVDAGDLNVLDANYEETTPDYIPSPFAYTSSPVTFILEEISNVFDATSNTREIEYELHVISDIPISTHGISGRVNLSDLDNLTNINFVPGDIFVNGNSIVKYDPVQKVIDFAITKTDKNNSPVGGSIGSIVAIEEDLQGGDPFFARIDNGNMMSANGVVSNINGSILYSHSNSAIPDLAVALSPGRIYADCNISGAAKVHVLDGTAPYTYTWSTGATTAQVSDLPIGTHSLTVSDAAGLTKTIDFEVEWAFTPVEVTTNSTQICINFDNAPLAEAVQVSLDNGVTYESPITTNTCYNVATGTHHIWIQRVADQCPVDLGTVTVGSNCTSRVVDANLVAIGGNFGQFANDEFIKNFLTAEKGYIRYQAEIHRILESKDARYAKVNDDFEKIKDMAMTMLFQSFVSKRPVTITDEHIKAIDNFLVSLSQATSKGKLRNEITKVRQHLHVMESKEVKDALIAFDQAGGTDTSEITPFDTPDQDEFDVQLLNTAGRESRVTYNIVKQGILNMSLYNTHGQQVMTLHNGISYTGQHQIPIDKNGLPPGIYFIHIEYIADGVPINKILKMAVMK